MRPLRNLLRAPNTALHGAHFLADLLVAPHRAPCPCPARYSCATVSSSLIFLKETVETLPGCNLSQIVFFNKNCQFIIFSFLQLVTI